MTREFWGKSEGNPQCGGKDDSNTIVVCPMKNEVKEDWELFTEMSVNNVHTNVNIVCKYWEGIECWIHMFIKQAYI